MPVKAKRSWARAAVRFLPAVLPLLLATAVGAGWPPPGVPSGTMPWEVGKYAGYPHGKARRPATPPPPPHAVATATRPPAAYTMQVTVLPHKHEYENRDGALVVAHVPEDAQVYIDGEPTKQRGMLRQYLTPNLDPAKHYALTVRVVWPEGGEWVSQMNRFEVRAGGVHCVDVVRADSEQLAKDAAANLAKLPAEDRKSAESQQFCAAQTGTRLGSMGVPAKIELNGKPVFLCCAGCEAAARRDAGKTLERVEQLKAGKVELPLPGEVEARLKKLSPEDRALAERQRYCAVETENLLGSMGVPVKVVLKGQPVFLCCSGCLGEARKDPDATLARAEELKAKQPAPKE